MATIYKRRKGKNEPYTIQYADHLGKRRTAIGFTDKGLTEQLAAKLETEARLRKTGMVDPEQEHYAANKLAPIEPHLEAFQKSLADNSPKHVKLTMIRIRLIVGGCGLEKLADITQESVQNHLRALRKSRKIGHKTYNHYLQAFESFCNWCVLTKRLLSSPVAGIERLNTAVDVRRPRRALTPDEMSKLLESARQSGKQIQKYSGELRARVYLLSYMTGLRKQELGSLTSRSFALDATPPTVTVEAVSSKRRRKDILPLHPQLVPILRKWLESLKPHQKLFPNLARKETSIMVKRDLERVGIPYMTEAGYADFHAAGRHSHITQLLCNGATLPEAKLLARHSDVNLTMRYTHIGIEDQARAVAVLPAPQNAGGPARVGLAALQMRCISGVSESPSTSRAGNTSPQAQRENPCRRKGFVADRRQLSAGDIMAEAGIEPARTLRFTGF